MGRPDRRLGLVILAALLLAAVAGPLFASSAAAFGERVYDSNTVVGGTDPFFLVYSGESVAQSFTASSTYILLNLTLRLRNLGGAGNTINITIRTDGAGVPSGTILAWSNPQAGGTVGPVPVPLTPTPTVTKGITYWIVATKGGTVTVAYEWHHSGANAYAGGKAMLNTGSGWTNPATATDMWFLTYGRELQTNMSLAMTASSATAQPKDLVTFTLYFNNTGDLAADQVWINETLPSGLTFVSDTAGSIPTATPNPNYTFSGLANGPYSFALTAQVNAGVAPATVLTNRATLAYTNATGVLRPGSSARASVIVGLQWKQLYLLPVNPGPTQGLTPVPPGSTSPQVTYNLQRGGASVDFELTAPLARTLRALNVTTVLYLDSQSHNTKNLDLNFTLFDANGATLTPVVYDQQRVTTDAISGFQKFIYIFPGLDSNFTAGHQLLLRMKNMGTASDNAVVATNATATPSQMDLLTSTYVRVDSLVLQDRNGPTTVWSPKDSLVVLATVSDPFGSSEVAGAWINITDPSGLLVVTQASMSLVATDPSSPSAWKRFSFTLAPALTNGTYRIEVRAREGNGVQAYALGQALVRAPSLSLSVVPTQGKVLSGDTLFYLVWYNNTGTGPAGRVWLNVSLAPQVIFMLGSPSGNMTGPTSWMWANVSVGNHLLLIEVVVRTGIPPVPAFYLNAILNVADEKGYPWPGSAVSAGAILSGPVLSIAVASSKSIIHSNETLDYSVTIRNSGDVAAHVWLNVTLPSGLLYVSDSSGLLGGSSTRTANGVAIVLTNMLSSATWTLDVTVRTGSGLARGTNLTSTFGLAYTNARDAIMPSSLSRVSVRVVAPVIVNATIRVGQILAVPGDIVEAFLNFTNAGDEASLSLVVVVTLIQGLSFASASTIVTVSGNSLLISLSNVGLGTTRIFLNLSVSRSAADASVLQTPGSIVYTDRIGNPLPLVRLAPANVTVTAPVLTLSATPANPSVEVGMTTSYNLTLANQGTGTAGDLWLNATFSAGLLYVSDTAGGQRTIVGPSVHWHWQGVSPRSIAFDLVVLARNSDANGTNAAVGLLLQFTDANGNRRPDVPGLLTATILGPTIELTLNASQDEVSPGATFYYTLRVRNSGGTMTKLLWLQDALSDKLSFMSSTASVPYTGTTLLNWTYRQLQGGEEEALTVWVQVPNGVEVGTKISNAIAATYTNSQGTIVGFAQSLPVFVTVKASQSPWSYALIGIAGAGGGFLFFVYWRRRSRIEEVFLVTKDGILIDHLARRLVNDQDPDVVSGMLTGIQQFVRDAFQFSEDRSLNQMEFGDYHVVIERGKTVFLAAVTSGRDTTGVSRRLKKVLEEIEAGNGPLLEHWNGDMDQMFAIRGLILKRLLK